MGKVMQKNLPTKEVARILGVCVQRVNNMIHQGHFPGYSRCECGQCFLIPKSDVDVVLAKRREGK